MDAEPRASIDKPVPAADNGVWGSDVIALTLRELGIRYIALNPGSSFRGLHDSLVNHLGNAAPQMLLCLHEEHAVAVAHGYAKVTDRPMAAVLHSNVGLMHGTMAIYNAWCDRVPMLILGAGGPFDAAERRPWIDWLHTAQDQGALIRHYVKWDDQPLSVVASVDALMRAKQITETAPCAPTYVCLDVTMQEKQLEAMPTLPKTSKFAPPEAVALSASSIGRALDLLKAAQAPVILAGRTSRKPEDWARRVALAEHLNAFVVTDIKAGAAFPTDHRLHKGKPSYFLDSSSAQVIKEADLVLSLDWIDLGGTLKQASHAGDLKVIHISLDHLLHNGWSKDHQANVPADLHLAAEPDVAVHQLADALGVAQGESPKDRPTAPALQASANVRPLDVVSLAAAMGEALAGECVSLVRLPLGWAGDTWHFRHPLDYLGTDGGAGIGSGPGMLVGAALAFQGGGRLPVAVLGDGDFMMGVAALWTAAHYKIPFVAIVSNNRSFFNDEIHQERVARERGRPVENKWIGQRISEPDIDLAGIARAQGLTAWGPVSTTKQLTDVLKKAVAAARGGASVVIDARVLPGYNPSMSSGMTRKSGDKA